MNLEQFAEVHGSRKAARALINRELEKMICGMGLNDLPDTSELCDLIDELEGVIESNKGQLMMPEVQNEIKEMLKDAINDDTIESLILG